jgi:hypothetical protein
MVTDPFYHVNVEPVAVRLSDGWPPVDQHIPDPGPDPDLAGRVESLRRDAERADAEGDVWWQDRLRSALHHLLVAPDGAGEACR